jgi:hypothetical protein
MTPGCCGAPNRSGAPRELTVDRSGQSPRCGRRWFGVGGCVAPGLMLVLLPKCPACLAAYFAAGIGAGLSTQVAADVRPLLVVTLVVSLTYLVTLMACSKVLGRRFGQ